ncbi:MAG: aminopeptidase [Eubacteriaceae bacterium]|nr:aminopeptidase [Eubacteriaceae bacterium]
MDYKELEKELGYEKESSWGGKAAEIEAFSERYKNFLANKTERECAAYAQALSKEFGFIELSSVDGKLKAGDKVYALGKGKILMLAAIGTAPLSEGLNIAAAHIDAPRIDLKPVPLYEDSGLAFFKTHYYGGIKKYQWLTIPLALHGVIYTKDGAKLEICIGEDESDPVFVISDLLVHLAADQMQKKASDVVSGEQLNVIVGSIPLAESDVSNKVKLNILNMLNEKYAISEESFLTAELEIVPAGKARDVGFDRGMIMGYAHDDRSNSFAALAALLGSSDLHRTSIVLLSDKEEVGSEGSTGMQSRFFENMMAEIIELTGDGHSDLVLRRCLANSRVLSMDVTVAYDPTFSEAFEKPNTALLGFGASLVKYVGSRGKSGSNDANSEYMQWLASLLKDNDVAYQTGELGKVDQGGGGTVAYMLAKYGADTIDYGVPVLSMHAPYELISKADLYSCYEGAKAFFASV